MHILCSRLLKHATHWLLDRAEKSADIAAAVNHFRPGVEEFAGMLESVLGPVELNDYNEMVEQYRSMDVDDTLARRIAALRPLYSALDVVDIADQQKTTVETAATAYFQLESKLELGWLREQIEKLPVEGHWQAIARATLRDNLYSQHDRLTLGILKQHRKSTKVADTLSLWLKDRVQRVQHAERTLSDMRSAGALDFATASVALQEIRKLKA